MGLIVKTTLLQRAAKLLGGKHELAAQLKVPEELLDAWMSGAVDMPDGRLPRLSAILTKAADKTRGGV